MNRGSNESKACNLSHQGLNCGFLNFHGKFKVRARDAPSPPVRFPSGLKKFDVRALTQIHCGRSDAGIEFLREPEERLRSPGLAISRPPDGNV